MKQTVSLNMIGLSVEFTVTSDDKKMRKPKLTVQIPYSDSKLKEIYITTTFDAPETPINVYEWPEENPDSP